MTEVACSCCGAGPEDGVVRLHSHRDIVICHDCLDWLNAKRRKKVAAVGGGAAIAGYEPAFSVADVERAVDHYQRLGFRTSHHDETYAFAHRGDLTIHLAHADGPAAAGAACSTSTSTTPTSLPTSGARRGAAVTGPQDYDYGKREGSHTDPDGDKLRFGSPLRSGSS